MLSSRPLAKGLVVSFAPTLAQLLWVFPVMAGQGYLGLKLGLLTPLVVVVLNAIWGISTMLAIRSAA